MPELLTIDEVLAKIRTHSPADFSTTEPRTFYEWIVRLLDNFSQEGITIEQITKPSNADRQSGR